MNKIFDIIKAAKFFPKYCPEIKNWKHKLRGVDGNKKEIEFNDKDKELIFIGIKILISDLSNSFMR